MSIEITRREVAIRKSQGSVYICRSCADVRNKIVMTGYTPKGPKGIYYNFCEMCIKSMEKCQTCQKQD